MNYEVVELSEKTVVGLTARTNNSAPDMTSVIGGLWGRFFGEGIFAAIRQKANDKSLGIYTDYAGNEHDDYSIVVACEVNAADTVPSGAVVKTIPAGRYAKFVVQGHLHTAVAAFWQQLWAMELPRAYTCDFEEYQNADPDNALIHIYIGLKDER